MTTPQPPLEDPSGFIRLKARVQHPCAPLTYLEQSRTDAVADLFRRNGREPNYEEIVRLVPPYKYVNADFVEYPLILGEKEGRRKIRLVSNGHELHLGVVREQAPAKQRECGLDTDSHWFGPAFKALLRVGADQALPAGAPRWRQGWLPVAEFAWTQAGIRYTLEAFGALLPDTTERLCAWLRMSMRRVTEKAVGQWALRLIGYPPLALEDGYLAHTTTQFPRAGCSEGWKFDTSLQTLTWLLPENQAQAQACVVLVDDPVDFTFLEWPASSPKWAIDADQVRVEAGRWLTDWSQPAFWQKRLDDYMAGWKRTLHQAATIRVPEPRVNHAHKNVRVSGLIIASPGQMSYSAHNQYERMYSDECGHASLGLAYWGHTADAARFLGHLAFYTQKRVTPHDLGVRLYLFCRYVFLTRDQAFLDRNLLRMRRWSQWLLANIRDEHHGLAAPCDHSGDLHHKIYSLSANSLAWRGLRDFSLLTGDADVAEKAASYRQAILRAVDASLDRQADPPFLPMSLYGKDEPTPETLTGSTLSSYWCLMAPYVAYSGVLGDRHPGMQAILDTFQRRGGLCAGLVRLKVHEDRIKLTCILECGLDDLYGCKLSEVFARRDDPDQLVLTLYGKLAMGLTLNTFLSGECCSLAPSHIFDPAGQDGRSMYLPPNTTSQMFLATLLRHCLVFDMDSQGDGCHDTLRLAFSTPRRWLAEGKRISVRQMPTAFGPINYSIVSRLESAHEVEARVTLPVRQPPTFCFLRLRTPPTDDLSPLSRVFIDGRKHTRFDPTTQTVDLSGLSGAVTVKAHYGAIHM